MSKQKRLVIMMSVGRDLPGVDTVKQACVEWDADFITLKKYPNPQVGAFINKMLLSKIALDQEYPECLQLDDDVVVYPGCKWPGEEAPEGCKMALVTADQERSQPSREGRCRSFNFWRIAMGLAPMNPVEATKVVCNSGVMWYRPRWAWKHVFNPGYDLMLKNRGKGPKGDQEVIAAYAATKPQWVHWLPEGYNKIWFDPKQDPPEGWWILHANRRCKNRLQEVVDGLKGRE